MDRRRPSNDIIAVERQAQLEEVCGACRALGRFAFDTEFVMEDRFEPEVCLIQIAAGPLVAIVDPFLELNLRPVWELVCDATVETVVHAGQEDLAFCVQHNGKVPRRAYDVQIAAGLAGYDYPLSLQKLIQATLHVRLHKSKTLTDWRRRPLTPEQVQYGAEDVCHLLQVREKLDQRLSQRNRSAWVREEFERFEQISLYRRAEEDKLLRVKGSGSLKGRQLAVVREVLAWRETAAQRLNRPVRAVLKDHLLVEIAKLELRSPGEIRDLRGINLSDRLVRALCEVVVDALNTPREQWPTSRPRDTETPKESALVALATAVIRGHCLENDISYSLLASQKSIRELVRHCTKGRPANRADVGLLNGWRGQTVGAVLKELFAGRRSVHVEPGKGECHIRLAPTDGTR